RLLQAMTQAFVQARDAVLAVDAAWERLLVALDDQDREAAALQERADPLGEVARGELNAARQRLGSLRARVEQDPLGVQTDVEEVADQLRGVRERLEKLAREREQVLAGLEEARRFLQRLEEAHRQTRQVCDERRLKVEAGADAAGLPRA